MLSRLAKVVAAGGDYDRAEILARQIIDPNQRAQTLGWLAEMIAEEGDHARAAQLINGVEILTAQLTDPYQRALALSQVADAVFAGGDLRRAVRLADEAVALSAQLTNPHLQATVFGRLAKLAVVGRDYARAEALTVRITDSGSRAEALARLAEAVDIDGYHTWAARLITEAEDFTGRIPNNYQRAREIANLALTLHTMIQNALPAREHPHASRFPLVRTPRSLVADALTVGSWRAVVSAPAHVDPAAVGALVDEVQARWMLNTPASNTTGTTHH